MTIETAVSADICLVRYGAVPEVARFSHEGPDVPSRGTSVVVETDRGIQLGTVLERLKPGFDPHKDTETEFKLVRAATDSDLVSARSLLRDCEEAFPQWCARISQWGLNLELVDLEWTLDRQKLILYVLCDRGPAVCSDQFLWGSRQPWQQAGFERGKSGAQRQACRSQHNDEGVGTVDAHGERCGHD